MKMANNRCNFLFLIGLLVLSSISVLAIESAEYQPKNEIIYLRNFDKTNIINEILSHTWIKNRECLDELNAIKKGLENHEEWAIKVMDSWGNFPSGILNGNLYELGSFSECFHIERNGIPYKSQYCIGYGAVFDRSAPKLQAKASAAAIAFGMCLPATCAVNYLETIVNDVIRNNLNNTIVQFPNEKCQFEESFTDWKPLDFVVIGIFGVALFLMVASTGYDIFATICDRTKYQPFIAFSMYTNGKKLFTCRNFGPSSGMIQCMDGIRALSVIWIVFIHTFRQYGKIPTHGTVTYEKYMETYRSAIFNAPLAPDSFFTLSGILVSYKLFKLLKKDGKLDIFSLYFNRLLRLTPILAVMVLIYVTIYRFLGNGPFWPTMITSNAGNCHSYWWSALLHIQNYVNPENEVCILQSWYLSVDTQLFIISPALAYLIYRFKKTALVALLVLIVCGTGYSVFLCMENGISKMFQPGYHLVYFPTHVRFTPWLIGFIAGYILFEFPKGSIRIPKKINWFAWTCILIVMPAVVIGNYQNHQPVPTLTPLEYGLFDSLTRIAWAIGLCYIIIMCYNSGGPVNSFLSLPMWQPISKISYTVYLVHCAIIAITMTSLKTPPSFSEMAAFQNSISIFALSAFVAIPLVLAFELPIDAIYKLATDTKGKKTLPISAKDKPIQQLTEKYSCTKIEKLNED